MPAKPTTSTFKTFSYIFCCWMARADVWRETRSEIPFTNCSRITSQKLKNYHTNKYINIQNTKHNEIHKYTNNIYLKFWIHKGSRTSRTTVYTCKWTCISSCVIAYSWHIPVTCSTYIYIYIYTYLLH
jgi:hypothetical protein